MGLGLMLRVGVLHHTRRNAVASAGIYANLLNIYHINHPDMDIGLFIQLRLIAFGLERMQQISAYIKA